MIQPTDENSLQHHFLQIPICVQNLWLLSFREKHWDLLSTDSPAGAVLQFNTQFNNTASLIGVRLCWTWVTEHSKLGQARSLTAIHTALPSVRVCVCTNTHVHAHIIVQQVRMNWDWLYEVSQCSSTMHPIKIRTFRLTSAATSVWERVAPLLVEGDLAVTFTGTCNACRAITVLTMLPKMRWIRTELCFQNCILYLATCEDLYTEVRIS